MDPTQKFFLFFFFLSLFLFYQTTTFHFLFTFFLLYFLSSHVSSLPNIALGTWILPKKIFLRKKTRWKNKENIFLTFNNFFFLSFYLFQSVCRNSKYSKVQFYLYSTVSPKKNSSFLVGIQTSENEIPWIFFFFFSFIKSRFQPKKG